VLATSLATSASDGKAPPPLVMIDVFPAFEALGNPDSLYKSDELHMSSHANGGYT
jgi:hypothetical protein